MHHNVIDYFDDFNQDIDHFNQAIDHFNPKGNFNKTDIDVDE